MFGNSSFQETGRSADGGEETGLFGGLFVGAGIWASVESGIARIAESSSDAKPRFRTVFSPVPAQ
jgi:hypothetical protein